MTSRQRRLSLAAVLLAMATGASAQSEPLGTPLPSRLLGTEVESDRGPEAFLVHQLSFRRVADARDATDEVLRRLFEARAVEYPAPELYLRVFKHERVLEVWARGGDDSAFTHITDYPVCAPSGHLGPKQRMGDFQVPEGFYFIDEFNPRSAYHLSLRVSYPNLSDRLRREAIALGGDIFVHGGCETVGCVPIEDDRIRELYWLAVQAMDAGQRVIPIHIFPSRMDTESVRWLERTFQPEPDLRQFWRNLSEGYRYFEATRQVPWITVAQDGHYVVPEYEAHLAAGDADATVTATIPVSPAAGTTALELPRPEPRTPSSAPPTAGPLTHDPASRGPEARSAPEAGPAATSAAPGAPGATAAAGAAADPSSSAEGEEVGPAAAEGSAGGAEPAPDPDPSAVPAEEPGGPIGVPLEPEPAPTTEESGEKGASGEKKSGGESGGFVH